MLFVVIMLAFSMQAPETRCVYLLISKRIVGSPVLRARWLARGAAAGAAPHGLEHTAAAAGGER
jgi:hypothetical protein